MSNQETNLEKFLKQVPWMRKWVHECAACHHRGYKPALPPSEYENSIATVAKLRRLVDELVLDESGVCEQCLQAGRGRSSRPALGRSISPKTVCEEKKRLEIAYREALQAAQEVESRLCEQMVSAEPTVKRRAKSELHRAQRHSSHILDELMTHSKKHGCGS